MTRRWIALQRLVTGAFFVLLGVHASRRSSAPANLEFDYYTDHWRHMRIAWESLRIGPAIYSVLLRDMPRLGDPLAYTFYNTPYLYPPAAVVLFLPWAAASYGGILSHRAAATALVCIFGAAAVVAAVRVWRIGLGLARSVEAAAFWSVFSVFFLLHGLAWGLHGQYDTVVVLAAVVAATAKTPSRRILWLGLAMALKFQALLFLPFLVREVWSVVLLKRRAIVRDVPAMVGLSLVAISLVTLAYLARGGSVAPMLGSPLKLAEWSKDRITLACLLLTASVAVVALMRGAWEASLTVVWAFGAFASLGLFQGWYILFVYPLAVLTNRRAAPWVAVWCLGFVYFLTWMPDPFRVADDLLVVAH